MIRLDLSDIPISPHQYRIAGILMLGVSILLLALGLIFATLTINRRDAGSRAKISAEECMKKIKTLNLEPVLRADTIHIENTNLQRGMELLASSSQVAALCPNWTLTNYCLGDACKPPGLAMDLKYSETK